MHLYRHRHTHMYNFWGSWALAKTRNARSRFLLSAGDIFFTPVVTCFNLSHVTTVPKTTSNGVITGHCYKLTQLVQAGGNHMRIDTRERGLIRRAYHWGWRFWHDTAQHSSWWLGSQQRVGLYHNNVFVSISSTSAFISDRAHIQLTSRCSVNGCVLVHQHFQRNPLAHTFDDTRSSLDCLSDPKVLP